MTVRYSLGDPLPTPWLRWGSFGGGERGGMCGHQPSAPTSLVPLGIAVALYERGSNNGASKEL